VAVGNRSAAATEARAEAMGCRVAVGRGARKLAAMTISPEDRGMPICLGRIWVCAAVWRCRGSGGRVVCTLRKDGACDVKYLLEVEVSPGSRVGILTESMEEHDAVVRVETVSE
jgi:hypothetical protein